MTEEIADTDRQEPHRQWLAANDLAQLADAVAGLAGRHRRLADGITHAAGNPAHRTFDRPVVERPVVDVVDLLAHAHSPPWFRQLPTAPVADGFPYGCDASGIANCDAKRERAQRRRIGVFVNDSPAQTDHHEAVSTTRPRHPPGWTIARGTLKALISDKVSIVAAGCAFYATLALFPAISMMVFLYGLVFDPVTVEPQLSHLQELLPPAVYALISERVHQLVTQQHGSLTLGLVISTLVTLWSSATGTKSLLAGLNLAHGMDEERGFLHFQFTAFAMTMCTIVAVVLAIAILVFLPAAISLIGLTEYQGSLIWMSSLTLLVGVVFLLLAVLFRFGPSRRPHSWLAVIPGAVLATVLWMVASTLFSLYVGRLASYDRTYGPLAAAVAVMMWLWVSVYVILLGAELNAELTPE
jgi:membrane protein